MGGYIWLLVTLGITIAVFGIGYRTFSRMAPEIAEEL
jgi:ABC-type polysaccharide/polyol phosphate export permease